MKKVSFKSRNHMALYDVPRFVDEAVSKLAPFFKDRL
jgi:hypothetical protein